MKLNTARKPIYTFEGATAQHINPELQLRRSVMACLLWEDNFYEDGISVAQRIAETIRLVKPKTVAEIAIEAREQMKLRHVPLLIVREMARLDTHKGLVAATLSRIIQRPDELSEYLSIYWRDGRCPVSAQSKLGLARAFKKFNEYSLQKYNSDGAIKLRDVLFMCHAKPDSPEQDALWKRLIGGTMATPDTWEVSLSATKGEGKKAAWENLLRENKLGALALIRNLRNMNEAGVDVLLIRTALQNIDVKRVLPFRFIGAARYNPSLEPELEQALFKCVAESPKLAGHTVILVDVSGSMNDRLSGKSELMRYDAACGLAMLCRELCESVSVYSFSCHCIQIPARRGFALRDAIINSQEHASTYTGQALSAINSRERYDRIIVITDEQSHDSIPAPSGKGYVVNVASYQNGIGYGAWTHFDGFSESILQYIIESERGAQ